MWFFSPQSLFNVLLQVLCLVICVHVQIFFILCTVTPRSALRNPDVSAILGTGSRTPRFVNTPRTKGSLSMVSENNSYEHNSLYSSWLHIFCLCGFSGNSFTWFLFVDTSEHGWQWLDEQSLPVSSVWAGGHKLHWWRQHERSHAKGRWSRRGWWIFIKTITNEVICLFKQVDLQLSLPSFLPASLSLFPEFLQSYLRHASTAVFDLLEEYEVLCQDKVHIQ